MASSPELDADPLPLLQLQEVDSSKAPERQRSPGLLPTVYSPPPGMDNHTVCIPSPYTDSSHEYSHGHAPLNFYSPPVLSYTRPPLSDSQSSLCPPLSPPAFWPSHHSSVPSLSLRCPQPLVYNEPGPHVPWLEPKAHSGNPSRWDFSMRTRGSRFKKVSCSCSFAVRFLFVSCLFPVRLLFVCCLFNATRC